ncbi:MAG: carbamoyltransferase C-terminal domain-containing protein, partial [Alphaproteobacteria bacterium]
DWHQGRMEFGPRSLGNRSILADPRSDKMQRNLNLKIKFREGFRPFAPAVLREDLEDWFKIKVQSPYMLLVADVNDNKKIQNIYNDNIEGFEKLKLKRSLIPAVTHVDYSARVQTVDKKYNKIFHDLIYEFKKITDVPILVNTSFNVRGEPIVCSPYDAFNCFMGTHLDYLIIGNYVLNKHDQDKKLISDYKNKYELD